MRNYFTILIIIIAFVSCTQVGRQIDEAREARKKSDSILKAFKEVNEELERTNDSIKASHDSILRETYDSSLRR